MAYETGLALTLFLVVGLALAGVTVFLSWAVRPLAKRPSGTSVYECGFPAAGDNRAIGFEYLGYAALFLFFDLAALYVYLGVTTVLPFPSIVGVLFLFVILGLAIIAGRRGKVSRAA